MTVTCFSLPLINMSIVFNNHLFKQIVSKYRNPELVLKLLPNVNPEYFLFLEIHLNRTRFSKSDFVTTKFLKS